MTPADLFTLSDSSLRITELAAEFPADAIRMEKSGSAAGVGGVDYLTAVVELSELARVVGPLALRLLQRVKELEGKRS